MDENPKTLSQNLGTLAVGILAAVIFVKGTIAIIPDAILRDKYGDIQGIFQLAFGVASIVIVGGIGKWFEEFMGWAEPKRVDGKAPEFEE